MSSRYRKGERFRVRSTGYAPPLYVDTSTAEENTVSVAAMLERERPEGLRPPERPIASPGPSVAFLGPV